MEAFVESSCILLLELWAAVSFKWFHFEMEMIVPSWIGHFPVKGTPVYSKQRWQLINCHLRVHNSLSSFLPPSVLSYSHLITPRWKPITGQVVLTEVGAPSRTDPLLWSLLHSQRTTKELMCVCVGGTLRTGLCVSYDVLPTDGY